MVAIPAFHCADVRIWGWCDSWIVYRDYHITVIMNKTQQWLKVPENRKKVLFGLIALNLMACSTMLLITASGQGALYEAIKPSVVEERYILQNQYVGDIVAGTTIYQGILIFDVIMVDKSLNEIGEPTKLYFATEHVERFDLQDGDVIVCSWLVQVTGERRIINVINLDMYNKVDAELYIFK